MIYNQACEHCRQKLRQGLNHASTFNSPIKERARRRRSSATSSSSTSQCQRPWLNERVLRAFDEPSVPEMFPQSQPEQDPYNTLNPDMYANVFQPSPDEAFDQMLQTLETDIEIENPGNMPMFLDTAVGCPNLTYGPDILSPQARALLHCFPELDSNMGPWACVPACVSGGVSGGAMVPAFSSPSVPVPPAPSPLNLGTLRAPGMDYLPQCPDPLLSLGGDCLQNIAAGKESGSSRSRTLQTDTFTHSVSRNRPFKKFQFVLEDIGGRAPVITQ
ncbi:hypothetical protein N7507_010754 [Penicillium longicatenatum]|nr:hypothetical protein N7507_010754 [Penicillium longicatenatum]